MGWTRSEDHKENEEKTDGYTEIEYAEVHMTTPDRPSIEQALEQVESGARIYLSDEHAKVIVDTLCAHLSCLDPSPEMVERAVAAHRQVYRDYDTGRTGPSPEQAMRAALLAAQEEQA